MKIRDIIRIVEKNQEFKSSIIKIFETDCDFESKLKMAGLQNQVYQDWLDTDFEVFIDEN